jgi:hypothetical protein
MLKRAVCQKAQFHIDLQQNCFSLSLTLIGQNPPSTVPLHSHFSIHPLE